MSLPALKRSQLAAGIGAVAAIAIVGSIAWGFAQQLVLAHQMRAEERRLEQAVATEQAHHDELVAQVEYAQSDEYVEHWARGEAKMSKPGEVAVVVVTDSGEAPSPEAQPTLTPQPQTQPFWITVWELLFGQSGR